MPRKREDDGIPVTSSRSNSGIQPYLPLLILIVQVLVLIVGVCGLLAGVVIDSILHKNGAGD